MTPDPESRDASSPANGSAYASHALNTERAPTDSQYLAEVSRDIRLGLQEVLKLAELALDTDLGPTQRDYLQIIRTSTQTLLGQVEVLLDMARLQTGALGLEQIPFNPAVLLADLANAIAASAQDRGQLIHCDLAADLPTQSQGDPGRIRQIISTFAALLLSDRPNQPTCIQTRRLAVDDPDLDWVQFSLLGLAQTADELRALFDPAAKDPVSRLGFKARLQLDTCKRLIEHLGGWIWIDDKSSPPGLRIGLPVRRLPRSERSAQLSTNWHGKRALIVDDHSEMRRTLAYWLRDWGFAVGESSSGTEALALARDRAFDLYIFDSVLPELDGFELAQRLKSEGLMGQGALVMLASLGQRGDAERCRSIGIDAFLTKPTTPSELRALLGQVLSSDRPVQDGHLVTRHFLAEYRPRLRILCIERDPVHQKLAAALFQQGGHEAVIVAECGAGLDCFQSALYDLVFIDLSWREQAAQMIAQMMMDGPAGAARRPPIIAMVTPGAECPEVPGLAGRITKPLTPQILDELIWRLSQQPHPPA